MNLCQKHPKYNGKKQPKSKCIACASFYIALNAVKKRTLPKPTKTIQSKKVYKRNKKVDF